MQPRFLDGKQKSCARGPASRPPRREQIPAVSVRPFGEGDWRQYPNSQPSYLGRRAGPDVYKGVIDSKGCFRRPFSPPGQVDRASRHDAGHRAFNAVDSDPVALELLIEQRRYRARHPAER